MTPLNSSIVYLVSLLAFWAFAITGWVSNLIWLLNAAETSPHFWVGLLGLVVAPIGVLNGWIVMF